MTSPINGFSTIDSFKAIIPENYEGKAQAISLKELNHLKTQEVKNSNPSMANRIGGYFYSKASFLGLKTIQGASWLAGKTAEYALFSSNNANEKGKNAFQLEALTGCKELGILLNHSIPFLSEKIKNKAIGDGVLSYIFESEKDFINQTFEVLLGKIIINVGKNLKAKELNADLESTIAPVDLILHVTSLFQTEVKKLQQALQQCNVTDEKLKKAACQKASQDAAFALLKILMPEGQQDLPLRAPLKNIFWDYLKNKVVPDLLFDMANFSEELKGFSKIDQLKNSPDQKLMVDVIKSCKDLLSSQFDNISEPSIAGGISKALTENFQNGGKINGLDLTVWLSKMLQALSKNEDPLVKKFKSIQEGLIETVISHIFYKLTVGMPKGSDPLVYIFENLMNVFSEFKDQSQDEIDKVAKELKLQGLKIIENEKYLDCFKPLSEKIIEVLGLQNISELLPKAIKPFVETIEVQFQTTLFPKILAKYYQQFLAPITELYHNVLNSSSTSYTEDLKLLAGGDFLAKEGVRLKSIIAGELPEYLVENQEVIADFGSRKTEEIVVKINRIVNDLFIKKFNLEKEESLHLDTGLKPKFLWIKPWLNNGLNALKNSQDTRILNTWRFIESRIDAIFAHSVRAMYKKKRGENSPEKGVSVEVIDEILLTIGKFVDLHGESLQKRYEEICKLHINPKDDQQFLKLFSPLCESLYEMFGFNDEDNLPIPDIFKPFLKDIVMDALPIFFARRFHEFLVPKEAINHSKLLLSEILIKNNFAVNENVITQIDNISDILSEKVSSSLIKSFSNLTYEGCRSENSVSCVLIDFKNKYFKDVVKSLILQALVNYLKSLKSLPSDENLVLVALNNLKDVINNRLSIDLREIDRADAILDPLQRKEALSEAMIMLSKELCRLFGKEDALKNRFSLDVPFENLFKGFFSLVESKLLPDVLADLYLSKNSWKNIIAKNRSEVLLKPNGKYIPESCRIIAKYVGSLLPVSLYRDQDLIAEAVFSAAKKYLNDVDHPKGVSVEEFLKENEMIFKQIFCKDLLNSFSPKGEVAKQTKAITEESVELLLIKFFNGLSERIHEKEGNLKNQDEFLVNLSIKLLSIANMHFKTINKISGKRQAFEVSHKEYLEGFSKAEIGNTQGGETLYPGIPKSEASQSADKKIASVMKILDRERARYARLKNPSDKIKCMERIKEAQKSLRDAKSVQELERQKFLNPLAEFILEIAKMSKPEDFPFPQGLQGEVFGIVKNKLIPSVLSKIYENIIDPSTINAMMHAGLVALNESMDAPTDPNLVQQEVPKDEKQQILNQVCGELILELLQQIPESYTRIILKIDKLKKFTTESVGESVRRQLGENFNLAKIIEKGLISGIASLHSGRWEEEKGKVKFIAGKWVENADHADFIPDHVINGMSPDDITFSFAMTDDQLEAEERKRIRAKKTAESTMKHMMVKTAHRLTSDAFFYSLKAPFIYFLNLWNKAVDYIFGKYAPNVREFIKYNGESFIFKLMENFFSWIYKWVTLIPSLFIDLHNSYKAEYFTRNMHLKIHENLLLGLSNALIETLSNNETSSTENIFDSLIKAAEARDIEAEKARQAYLKHWNLKPT